MADFTALKTAIQNAIKQNGNEEITGAILQEIMLAVVSTLGDSAINDLVTALDTEVTNRQNADATFQSNINAEQSARQLADSTLQSGINNERDLRVAADNALQNAINAINTKLAEGYVYVGIATTSTNPSTPSGKVFYIAVAAGTYTNFLNSSSQALVLTQGVNILKYNGTSWSVEQIWGVDDAPTPSSDNLVKSSGVFNNIMTNGSAFDITAYNNGTTYADLNAALTALNALPADYKKGGMSLKFVRTSDNKYVQYRLMSDTFNTTEANWQGVDDEPTVYSENLVKSGGLVNYALGMPEIDVPSSLFTEKIIISTDGVQSASPTRNTTDFIPIAEGVSVIYSNLQSNNAYCSIALYSAANNESFVSGVGSSNGTLVVPSGVNYIRMTSENSQNPIVKLKNILVNNTGLDSRINDVQKDIVNPNFGIKIKTESFDFSHDLIRLSDGNVTTNPNRKTTDFIGISDGIKIVFSGLEENTTYCSIAFYSNSNNGSYVSGISQVSGEYVVPAGQNIKYARFVSMATSTPSVELKNGAFDAIGAQIASVSQQVNELKTEVDGEENAETISAGVVTVNDYPNVSPSSAYGITDYIPVQEGEVFRADLAMTTSGYAVTGYAEQSQESAVSSFRIIGNTGSSERYDFVIPAGVNYIRLSSATSAEPDGKITYFVLANDSNSAKIVQLEKSVATLQKTSEFLAVDYKRYTRFPNTAPRKACVFFQMDGNPSMYVNLLAFQNKLKEYGVKNATYAVLPSTLDTYANDIINLYNEGNEIGVHGEANTRATSAIIQGYLSDLSEIGVIPYGFVPHSVRISDEDLLESKEFFSWIIKNSGDYSPTQADFLDSIMSLSDVPTKLKRLSLEIAAYEYETVKNTVIANAKSAIDKAVQDKGMVCFYGHSYAINVAGASYTIYADVLDEVLQYLAPIMAKGLCVTGNTADMIEYYYTKRFDE